MMRQKLFLFLAIFGVFLCGCDYGIDGFRAKVEEEFAAMSLDSDSLAATATSRSDRLFNLMEDLADSERGSMVSDIGKAIVSIELPNTTFDERLDALERYRKLVSHIVENMASQNIPAELTWKFRLKAFSRIRDEISLCKTAPEKCAHQRVGGGRGGFMTRRQYLDMLQLKNFETIRANFETGDFVVYFKNLSEKNKEDWIAHLTDVAQREVRIFDPDHPVPLPLYVPEDNREWVPTCDGSAPIEYTEYFGDGSSFRMKKVRRKGK